MLPGILNFFLLSCIALQSQRACKTIFGSALHLEHWPVLLKPLVCPLGVYQHVSLHSKPERDFAHCGPSHFLMMHQFLVPVMKEELLLLIMLIAEEMESLPEGVFPQEILLGGWSADGRSNQ